MKPFLITTVAALALGNAAFADTKIIAPVASSGLVDSSGNAVITQAQEPVTVAQPVTETAPIVTPKPAAKAVVKHNAKMHKKVVHHKKHKAAK